MKVTSDIGKIKPAKKSLFLAIGVFDGVHCGHAFLIRKAVRAAKATGGQSVVMTFYPHPQNVLAPERKLQYLTPLAERLKLISDLGVDVCILIKFTKNFSRLTAQKFIEDYIMRPFHPQKVFVGKNFRFGNKRRGDIAFFKKFGQQFRFQIDAVASVKIKHRMVSSSLVRQFIQAGKVELAGRLLGRAVAIFGKVVKGDGRGKSLGFPTANIRPLKQIIPLHGVYAAEVVVDGKIFQGMANIGTRPSFHKQKAITIEVHIFHLHRNLYHRDIEIRLIKRIRNERKFSSPKLLISQLHKDKNTALKLLSRLYL